MIRAKNRSIGHASACPAPRLRSPLSPLLALFGARLCVGAFVAQTICPGKIGPISLGRTDFGPILDRFSSVPRPSLPDFGPQLLRARPKPRPKVAKSGHGPYPKATDTRISFWTGFSAYRAPNGPISVSFGPIADRDLCAHPGHGAKRCQKVPNDVSFVLWLPFADMNWFREVDKTG
jgi:hypothetical protein